MRKSELLRNLENQREAFLDALEDISDEAWLVPGVSGEWSIKDILAHISRWEAELVKLLWQVQHGQRPTSIHFQKINVDEINSLWQKESQTRPLHLVLEDFHSVRNQTILRVESINENDLTDPKRFKWSNGKPLWERIANDSFGHEEEHLQSILAWKTKTSP